MTVEADKWKEFNSEFTQLAREEERIEQAGPKDRLLYAMCDYSEHPEVWHEKGKPEQGSFCLMRVPETGLWMISDGVSENFQERFRALAARAGAALGDCPKGTHPEDFWLHRLFSDLRENRSKLLAGAQGDDRTLCKAAGIEWRPAPKVYTVKRVCVASATFCSRLERKAVTGLGDLTAMENQAESSRAQNIIGHRKAQEGMRLESRNACCQDWHRQETSPLSRAWDAQTEPEHAERIRSGIHQRTGQENHR